MTWDVFISHAWEDKEAVARPLADALTQQGLGVWYDEFTLTIGDSLRRSIDYGLAHSTYGLVILSPSFFAKEWPQRELDGLVARESGGEKVILPVWHDVTKEDVAPYSPMLADRLAALTSEGLEVVVQKIIQVVRPQPIRWRPGLSLSIFDERMREAFPGVRGLVTLEDPAETRDGLEIILRQPLVFRTGEEAWYYPIWWLRGMTHYHVERYRCLETTNVHLINEFELDVRLMTAYRSEVLDCQFVYLESPPLEQSGLYHWTPEDIQGVVDALGWAYERVGFFRGRYITETEFDDGYATIGGEVVKTDLDAEERMRPITDYNLFVAPVESRIANMGFEQEFEALCNELLTKQTDLNRFVRFVRRLPRRSDKYPFLG